MRNTVTVMATDPAYSVMIAAATEALRQENLRIVVRGQHNRKDGLLPVERFGLNFFNSRKYGRRNRFQELLYGGRP